MNATFPSVVASTYLLASSTLTHASCSTAFTDKFASAERIVDSLRPDKSGQIRVFASDGSEFTAGQALWMKGQLRSVLQACARGDEVSAAKVTVSESPFRLSRDDTGFANYRREDAA